MFATYSLCQMVWPVGRTKVPSATRASSRRPMPKSEAIGHPVYLMTLSNCTSPVQASESLPVGPTVGCGRRWTK